MDDAQTTQPDVELQTLLSARRLLNFIFDLEEAADTYSLLVMMRHSDDQKWDQKSLSHFMKNMMAAGLIIKETRRGKVYWRVAGKQDWE